MVSGVTWRCPLPQALGFHGTSGVPGKELQVLRSTTTKVINGNLGSEDKHRVRLISNSNRYYVLRAYDDTSLAIRTLNA